MNPLGVRGGLRSRVRRRCARRKWDAGRSPGKIRGDTLEELRHVDLWLLPSEWGRLQREYVRAATCAWTGFCQTRFWLSSHVGNKSDMNLSAAAASVASADWNSLGLSSGNYSSGTCSLKNYTYQSLHLWSEWASGPVCISRLPFTGEYCKTMHKDCIRLFFHKVSISQKGKQKFPSLSNINWVFWILPSLQILNK